MTPTDRGPQRALAATIGFFYDRERLASLVGDLRVAGLLDLEAPPKQKMRLTVTANSWRVDLEGPTMFGSGMTLIRHQDGGGEYLHHATKTRLAFEAGDVPPAAVTRQGNWRIAESADSIEVFFEDPLTAEQWVQRIRTGEPVDDVELLRGFTRALLAGGPQRSQYPGEELVNILSRRGLPIEVSLQAQGSDKPISRFTVTDVVLGETLPPGDEYRDLRDAANRKIWDEPGPDLRDVPARDLDDIRTSDGYRRTTRMRDRDNDGPDREPPERPPRRPGGPPVPPVLLTNAAQVALRIEQRLLDDIQKTVNSIAAHLSGVTTQGTELVIPWLEDMVKSGRSLAPFSWNNHVPVRSNNVPGTMLPALLHEDPGPRETEDWTTDRRKACVAGGGRGVIDRMAITRAGSYLTSGSIPGPVLAGLDVPDRTAILTALTMPAPARLGSLSTGVLTRFVAAVAFEDIGTLRFSLNDLRKPVNFHDLYIIQMTDFQVSVGFPSITTDNGTPVEAQLLTGLRCRTGGTIEGAISLAALNVDALIGRTPGWLYWTLLVAGGPLITIFLPQFAWIIPFLWAISVFLASDFARFNLFAQPLSATFNVSFAPGSSSPALRPRVSVRLHGTIRTRILSYVPTGIHQLVDWAIADFANLFGITLTALEGQLGAMLQKMLTAIMGDGVPGSLLRLGVPVGSGQAAGEDDRYIYLESTFNDPVEHDLRITPVPVSSALRFDLDRDIARVFGAGGGRGRHYLSFGASINAIDQVAAVLWSRGEFEQTLTGASAAALRSLLAPPFTGNVSRIAIYHGAPPVFSLPPAGPAGPQYYFDGIFPSVFVEVNRGSTNPWTFRYRITCRGVFAMGTTPGMAPFLSITGIRPNIFEAMLDLNSVNAALLEALETQLVTITTRDAGDDPRHPQVIHTHREVVEETTDRTQAAPAAWTQYGRGIFLLAIDSRDARRVPRLDHVKGNGSPAANPIGPIDADSQQTYSVDGSDPDDAQAAMGVTVPTYVQTPVDWGFIQGLAFAHLETAGALRILSGTPHLNSFQAIDAELLYRFVALLPL